VHVSGDRDASENRPSPGLFLFIAQKAIFWYNKNMIRFLIYFAIIFIFFLSIDLSYCGHYGDPSHCNSGPEFEIYSVLIFIGSLFLFFVLKTICSNIFKGKPYLSKVKDLILIFILLIVIS